MLRRSLFSIAVVVSVLLARPFASPQPPSVAVSGPAELLFDYSLQACDTADIPDHPARAFRDVAGQTHLFATHHVTRQAVGATLDTVVHDCAVLHTSEQTANPAAYAAFEWITAPYTTDGVTVNALVHDEYQGHLLGDCPSGEYLLCWYNAITHIQSFNGGSSWSKPASYLVASAPYQYVPDGGPFGYFQPSNIILKSGFYYALFHAEAHGAQAVGTCVMRTADMGNASAWRFWTGSAWTGTFVNPYTSTDPPANHVCAIVGASTIAQMHESVTYNTFFQHFLLVGMTSAWDPALGRDVYGVYFALSDDLVTWTPRKLLVELQPSWHYQCGDLITVLYPSALDPASTDRNYSTTGQSFYIYMTESHHDPSCASTGDHDLIRLPVTASGAFNGKIK